MFESVAIVGVGLIGGSIGLALQERGLCQRIIGIGRKQASLDEALRCQTISESTLDLTAGVKGCDLVVICTPVASVVGIAEQVASAAPHALITDAASTKSQIVTEADTRLPVGTRFVGSHPIAGSHQAGPAAARANLFEGRRAIVTPTARTAAADADLIEKFWTALGMQVQRMDAGDHDASLALTSHLPHLLASAMAAATPDELLSLAGSGWRDTCRVAAGNVELWQEIFLDNGPEVLKAVEKFGTVLDEFQQAIADRDAEQIAALLRMGKQQRDAVGN